MTNGGGGSREEHVVITRGAIQAYGEIMGRVAALRDLAEIGVGKVASATGGTANGTEAGQNAFQFAASLPEAIDELYNHVAGIVAELQRYEGGF